MILQMFMSLLFFIFTANLSADAVKESAQAAKEWLAIIDQGKYESAWEQGALTLKLRVPLKSWLSIMEASRKPLGSVLKRAVIDQRESKNPPGLPLGDYMVMIYKTDFGTRKGVDELVTLVHESDGKWRGLTYQVGLGE